MTKTFRAAAIKLGAATMLASLATGAFAHTAPAPASAQDYVAHYESAAPAPAASDSGFNMSGTRGRLGLGANATHPEGPGNVTN